MAGIADNLQVISARISRARGVTLLAVSKGQPVARIEQAVSAGQKAFGENYVQEAVQKMEVLPALEWHLIGPLQSNKTRIAAERFAWVQTVASEKIARRLSEQRPASLPPLNVLIQVNVSGEASKSGVELDEVENLARAIATLPRLKLRGLMAIPEPEGDFDTQRVPHRALARLLYDLNAAGQALDTLSMGMSADLEAAIAEGATVVRVGGAIFGERRRPAAS